MQALYWCKYYLLYFDFIVFWLIYCLSVCLCLSIHLISVIVSCDEKSIKYAQSPEVWISGYQLQQIPVKYVIIQSIIAWCMWHVWPCELAPVSALSYFLNLANSDVLFAHTFSSRERNAELSTMPMLWQRIVWSYHYARRLHYIYSVISYVALYCC